MNPAACLAQLAGGGIGFKGPEPDNAAIKTLHSSLSPARRLIIHLANQAAAKSDTAMRLCNEKDLAGQVDSGHRPAQKHPQAMESRSPMFQIRSRYATRHTWIRWLPAIRASGLPPSIRDRYRSRD